MSEVSPLPCVRISHESSGGITVSHPEVQLRFDSEEQHPRDLIVQTGLLGGGVQLPTAGAGVAFDALHYSVPAGRRPWSRGERQAAAVQVTLPGGGRLVHLGAALSGAVDPDWVAQALETFSGAQWFLVGVPEADDAVFLDQLRQFGAEHFLMLDLNAGGLRRRLDRSAHIAPVVDRARSNGLSATSLAPRVSVRFDLK